MRGDPFIGVFLEQCTTAGVDASVDVDDLYAAYLEWLGDAAKPVSRTRLVTATQRFGVIAVRRYDGTHLAGIRLESRKPSEGFA